MTHVGQSLPHESAEGHVTGRALYTDDLTSRFAGLLHAWPVQSPHAHAQIRSMDLSKALIARGVATVLTGTDVPGEGDTGPARKDERLFPDEVLHEGQAVAWILAETEQQARDAVPLVSVDYEALTAILTIGQALAGKSYLTDPAVIRRGDPETALGSARHRLQGEITTGAQEHFYLEAQAAIAYREPSGLMHVISSTQHPTETQAIVARVLGVRKHEVVCESLRMGGAFGGKETQANPWAAVAALGAWKTGRPVSVRLDRQRDMSLTGKRHPFFARYDAGFDDEGHLVALKADLFSDGGYSLDLSRPIMGRAMFHLDNCYFVPNLVVTGRALRTHKVSNTAFRGFGGPQGMLVMEEVLDRIARALKIAPHLVRERNFYREGQTTHYGQEVRHAERIGRIWSLLRGSSEHEARLGEIERFNAAHTHKKRGLAITPVKFGISFTTTFFNQAGALVLIYQDGSVQLNHGGTEMGQGLHTKMRQVAADVLGVGLDSIRVMSTRTDKVPNTSATAASSGSDLNGAAVRAACLELRSRLCAIAAARLGVEPSDIDMTDGSILSRGTRAMAFAEVVQHAYLERVPLFAAGHYRTPDIHFDEKTGRGKPFHYFAYGAAASEVEVDGLTGQFALRRVDILHDVGHSISPLVDRGQVEGGFIQGVGWLTREEVVWDKEGRLTTRGASTYKLPGLGDCPDIFNVRFLPRAAEPGVVYGSKAVGEPPLMLALSVREALREAIVAFGSSPELVTLSCPSTPEAIYWAIKAVRETKLAPAISTSG